MQENRSSVGRLLSIAIAASALLFFAAAPATAGCSKSVVLYNAYWCPYCKQVRAILARNNIKYTIKDATTAPVQAEMVRRFGDTAIPRTIIGGTLVEGVDEERILQLCRQPAHSTPQESSPLQRSAETPVPETAIPFPVLAVLGAQ
jgi:glutaredoxin